MSSTVVEAGASESPAITAAKSASHFVRKVGGEVRSAAVAHTSVGRIEIFNRKVIPRLDWHFCQPETTLFWHRDGFRRMRGTVDGRPVDCTFVGKSRLSIFPREAEIKMDFDLQPSLDYAVVFFDPAKVGARVPLDLHRARLAFCHEGLLGGMSELCRQAQEPDNLFELFAEGWALQALAHVARIAGSADGMPAAPRGGLSARARSRVDMYIRENLAQPLTLEELALVAGLSKRHFLRAFAESVGVAPHRFVVGLRIEEAKRQLAESAKPITGIALDCGFSHAQHFSATFRKSAGMTPLEYRQAARTAAMH
jgi:AraC family transcriptional regulator